jgi:predicted AAA+ superfamily ATPase
MLVRRLAAWHGIIGKRLVKSPKVYVRDSGLVHALLGLIKT